MTLTEWHDSMAKPTWTPPPATISLIWMIFYPITVPGEWRLGRVPTFALYASM